MKNGYWYSSHEERPLFQRGLYVALIIILAALLIGASPAPARADSGSNMSVFASGLNAPRGLKFGPDGMLYVAEGGTGGSNSTIGQCEQVVSPIGPYTGSETGGRISRIDWHGNVSTVTDSLPSSQTSPESGALVSGVADVAFYRGRLYAILSGAGCSHGVADTPNGVVRVERSGSWKLVANLSAFQQANPTAVTEEEDFEPDGTWYSMIRVGNYFYAVEPNHGELDRISPRGDVSRVIDISASQGHIVPTALAYRRGHFYVGNLETFPVDQGAAKILDINLKGEIVKEMTGFTNIVGLVPDLFGNLYVLESFTGNPFPTPDTGVVIRVNRDGSQETIATGLSLPTAMTMGWDGNLYVSNKGYGYPAGMGEIVKIELEHSGWWWPER